MSPTLDRGVSGGEPPGFYVQYARLIAQICLMARRDPALGDLAMLLRGPEGGGTYARREALWPSDIEVSRAAAGRFAIWIKGRALLGAAVDEATPADQILKVAVAALVLGQQADEPNK